ncbi:uncharacterized protein LOC131668385 [Phymastichus coffea]|uniref:uncharacterized protein LOC131668385 n=1 Tax=Phymastichus coffea TaxID=108790 RepID=UPI00273AFE50|nr:uncharacterized protein LOC131668385 [Phymastichus coffea]
MKISVTVLCLVVLAYCSNSHAEVGPKRQKRSVTKEMCPENITYAQCVGYAKKKSKTLKYCHHQFVGGKNLIEWQTCESVSCEENTILIAEDLSKPYPDCCEWCEIIDATNPATFSSVV